MRRRPAALVAIGSVLATAPAAWAEEVRTVQAGETLWSIASGRNFTTRAIAAYNGLSEDARVVAGTTIKLPTVPEAAAVLAQAPPAAPVAAAAPATSPAPSAAPPVRGAYTVRPGDSLSALAAQAGVSLEQMAYMNGLDPNGVLLIGTVLKLPGGAPAPAGSAQPAPAQRVVPPAPPNPSGGRVSADQVAQIASAHGVPSSLAAALAWQESGFNNAMVSSANARGVMQVLPGTWDWVQQNLARRPLDPNAPLDNVHAGVLYLRRMLDMSGGDPAVAAAGYYQGMASVRRNGMLPETQRYVSNVLALRSRFGG